MKHVILVVAALAIGACTSRSDRETPSVTHTADPADGDVIDKKLMLALSQAKNLHHKAKVYTSDGDVASAIASVREILSLHFPPNAPEADDVRNDARALLARLLVGQGQLDEAMSVVTEGLAQSQRESFFVANLYTVKGEILEAHAALLDTDPANKPHAIELRHAAIRSEEHTSELQSPA